MYSEHSRMELSLPNQVPPAQPLQSLTRLQVGKHAPLTTHGLPKAPSRMETGNPHRFTASSPEYTTSPTQSITSSYFASSGINLRAPSSLNNSRTPITPGSFRTHRLALAPSVDSSPITPLSSVFSFRHGNSGSSCATSIAPSSPGDKNTRFDSLSSTTSPISPTLQSPTWMNSNFPLCYTTNRNPPATNSFKPLLSPVRSSTPASLLAPQSPLSLKTPATHFMFPTVRAPAKSRHRPPPLKLSNAKKLGIKGRKIIKNDKLSPIPPNVDENSSALYYSDLPLRRIAATQSDLDRNDMHDCRVASLARIGQKFKTGLRAQFPHKTNSSLELENREGIFRRPWKNRYSDKVDPIDEVEQLHWTEM